MIPRPTRLLRTVAPIGLRLRGLVGRLARDRRGATAIEFALIMVPFLGLFLAVMQAGLYFFASEAVEVAVEDAARKIYTGVAQSAGISTAAAFRTAYLCPATGGRKLPSYIDCSKLIIDVRNSNSSTYFAGVDMSADFYKATTQFCPGAPGRPGDLTVVRVIYPLPAIIPVLTGSLGTPVGVLHAGMVNDVPGNSGWKQLILATVVFQNEPYDGTSYVAPTGC